jgi:hypothetical protein
MAQGTSTCGDIIKVTIDNVDTSQLWSDFADSLEVLNSAHAAFAGLLTHNTTNAADLVPQASDRADFEEASEFGEPKGIRLAPDTMLLGFDFRDYDSATRYTWRFLRDATADQINGVHNLALSADGRLVYTKVLSALLNPVQRLNPEGVPIYGLWSGDGNVPPDYITNTFDGSHTHYTVSGAAVIDSGDVEALIEQVTEHGFGVNEGEGLLVLTNPAQARLIRSWRAGQVNANGQTALWDFIPAEGTPAFLSAEQIIGDRPPASYQGLKVAGSYGPALVIEHALMPAGYVAVVATGGPGSSLNPVGFREHKNPSYRGLRMIPGPSDKYPLTSSFYSRSFGCGIRNRGSAAVMQIKATGSYAVPVVLL